MLRKINTFTSYNSTKDFVESLFMTRLDFSDIVFYPLSENLLKTSAQSSFQKQAISQVVMSTPQML